MHRFNGRRSLHAACVEQIMTIQDDLWELVLRWRREALNLQHQQPRFGPLRVSGEERARCADELEALLSGQGTDHDANEEDARR